jgi:hypothetical protein
MGIVILKHLPRNLRELTIDFQQFKVSYKKCTFKPIFLFDKWIPGMVRRKEIEPMEGLFYSDLLSAKLS